jgi:hypothetical protein
VLSLLSVDFSRVSIILYFNFSLTLGFHILDKGCMLGLKIFNESGMLQLHILNLAVIASFKCGDISLILFLHISQ